MKQRCRHLVPHAATLLVLALLLLVQNVTAKQDDQQGADPSAEVEGMLAASSTQLSYQGQILDANGDPVNATVTMEFALFDAANSGNLKWGTETQSVQVTDGLFHVLLGSVTPINPANLTGDLWLDIKVNGEQLTPREMLAAVPYAMQAGNLAANAQAFGNVNLADHQLNNVRALQLKDWDDDTGGSDSKYRLLARDGSWQFYNGGVVVGGYKDGTWSDLSDGTLIVKGKVGVGTTNPSHGQVQIETGAVPLVFRETDQTGAGSLWRMPLDGKHLRFDASQNGTSFSGYKTPLTLWSDGSISCGALTEANLQTPGERAAGRSDRFEEGDVLCWGIDRLEKCAAVNDRLVQAVADKSGRPIVIGAELVKVIGPVRRGDILVASDVPGYAMVNNDPVPGSVIAQALEDFNGEMGTIKAMIRKF